MIEDIFNILFSALYESFWISLLASFGWGVLSILLSPCHLSSIPLVIGFINSQGSITIKRTFSLSLIFSIGILITIAVIGLITASMGRIMGDIGKTGNILVALIFFIIGLYLLDVIKLPWDSANIKTIKYKGAFASLILGLLFGIGLGPCTFAFMAPILGVVFELSQTEIIKAILLLFAFAIGHCSVIVFAGTLTKKVQQYLNWTEKSRMVLYIKRSCGGLVILGGFYLIYTTI